MVTDLFIWISPAWPITKTNCFIWQDSLNKQTKNHYRYCTNTQKTFTYQFLKNPKKKLIKNKNVFVRCIFLHLLNFIDIRFVVRRGLIMFLVMYWASFGSHLQQEKWPNSDRLHFSSWAMLSLSVWLYSVHADGIFEAFCVIIQCIWLLNSIHWAVYQNQKRNTNFL